MKIHYIDVMTGMHTGEGDTEKWQAVCGEMLPRKSLTGNLEDVTCKTCRTLTRGARLAEREKATMKSITERSLQIHAQYALAIERATETKNTALAALRKEEIATE